MEADRKRHRWYPEACFIKRVIQEPFTPQTRLVITQPRFDVDCCQ